jgi:tetratricopeptide (TPR) repeat protein
MTATLQQWLDEAYALHGQGQFAEAERLYTQILALHPDHSQALLFLGVLDLQTGQTQRGVERMAKAIKADPQSALAHTYLGNGLRALARRDEALASFDRALALAPRDTNAHYSRALVLADMGRLAEALAAFDKTISLQPDHAEAHHNRADALMDLQRLTEAVAGYEHAIALKPDFAQAYCNRGLAQRALGRPQDALTSYDKAIALRPDFAQAHHNRGNVLMDLGLPAQALASYDKALVLQPAFAEARINRGLALMGMKRPAEALADFDQAIALHPDLAEAHLNRGLALTELKELEAALASFDQAIALKPGFVPALWNQSHTLLLLGRFEEGWRLHEYRKQLPEPIASHTHAQPVWLGAEDIAGKTLLVESEQGFGDVIQFARYTQLAQARGANVIFSVRSRLVRLMKSLDPPVTIIDSGRPLPQFHFHIPLLSMPLAFRTDRDTIPATIPYLHTEPDRAAQWKAKLGSQGFRIGICWQGSRLGATQGKPFSVAEFRAIAQIPHVRLISLQKGEGAEQLQDLPPGMSVESLGEHFDAGADAFVDTAAVMESLDLIITTDTSVAHLAGALGRSAWVALKYVPDWRWLLDRPDSPWYPTLRLFRQPAYDDWPDVFAQMEARLRDQLT